MTNPNIPALRSQLLFSIHSNRGIFSIEQSEFYALFPEDDTDSLLTWQFDNDIAIQEISFPHKRGTFHAVILRHYSPDEL